MPEATAPNRHAIAEGDLQRDGVRQVAALAGIGPAEASELLREASLRVGRILRIRHPIHVSGGALRVVECAGLIRVAPDIELEIVPKFLDGNDLSWREDFFLIATLSRGHILPRDRISSGRVEARDLPTLVGAAMVDYYQQNERQPLRIYRRRSRVEYALDGDVEPEELFLPDTNGFRQNVTVLDRENEYNATIRAAILALLPEVRHAETRIQLMRVFEQISPQTLSPRQIFDRPVPTRYRAWQPMYDLAVTVLRGLGSDLSGSGLIGPGFALKTWTAWQDLLEIAVRDGLPGCRVQPQEPFNLGTRNGRTLRVRPDVVLRAPGATTPTLLVDAKYKIAKSRGGGRAKPRIGEADVYESLAFLRASGATRALLLYPREHWRGSAEPAGTMRVFEHITVGHHHVWAAEVEVRGIAAAGLLPFSEALATRLQQLI